MGLKELIESRNDILFAEIGALIHDLGKLSEEFISSKSLENLLSVNDEHSKWIFDWYPQIDHLSKGLDIKICNIPVFSKKGKKLTSVRVLLKDLIENHHNDKKIIKKFEIKQMTNQGYANKYLITLFSKSADGVDSGIDKGATANVNKQRINYTYISTSFGYEFEKIDLSKLKYYRENFIKTLEKVLKEINGKLNSNKLNVEDWIKLRNELLDSAKNNFLHGLGETRRPANDVTLWDHSFSVASLYKAALAEIIITKEWKDPKEIKWKLLSIRFDGNTFYNAVPKIGNVLGRKELVKKVLDAVKDFLEVVIPIGNEIYRDENGSVFLVPECANENGIFDLKEIWEKIENIKLNLSLNFKGEWEDKELKEIIKSSGTLRELIENIASFMSEGTFVPEIRLSKASRGALNMGEEVSKIEFPRVNYEVLQKEWENKKEGYERCSVCGLKPIPLTYEEYITLSKKIKQQGWENLSEDEKKKYKAYERKVCLFCLKLAQDRVRVWWSNEKWDDKNPERPSRNTSIWLDEIADENNRVALVYLSFDLSKWLNGEMLNTFLSKPLKILKEIGLSLNTYDEIVNHIKEKFNEKDENFWKIFDPYSKNKTGEELFKEIVENRDSEWKKTFCVNDSEDEEMKAKILLLHLTRKHPSFARIRRIWETTKEFSIMCFKEILSFLPKRNRLVFKFSSSFEPAITHTYWIKIRNKFYEVAIVEEDTAVVINKFENVDFLKEILKNLSEEVGIYLEPSEGKEIGKINIVKTSIDLSNQYFPAIPFMFEPTSCLFFVPLNKAWEIVKFVKEQYEIHFNKVQDKLPLKLGFVAFHKRMPMYAVLDAVKRMMKFSKNGKSDEKSNEKEKPNKKSKEIEVIVKDIEECPVEENCKLFEGKIGNKVKKLTLDFGKGKEFTYYVSYSTGDPEKEDIFHPYFIVKDQTNGWQTFVERKWQTIKHVSELKKDDKISFYPSYFDFLWLDTNTRRYDAGEDRKHWVFKNKSPKPYFLKEIEHFERLKELLKKLNLTSSQILNAYEVLMNKILEWELDEEEIPLKDKIFEEFVEGVIFNVPLRLKKSKETSAGKISEEDYKFLKNSVLSGLFFDFIDLWHTILKRKFEEEKNEKK